MDRSATTYVVLSDVHLGADLVEHVRPWSRDSWLREQAAVDVRLVSLLRHYACASEVPVCFVLAGDFVDFMGMSILAPPDTSLRTGLTDEERAHGLGSAADHAVLKLRAVARRHEGVFRALAEVLAAGHSLVVVRGNHDLEWHWSEVQRAFVQTLGEHAKDEQAALAIKRSVSFRAWFFYVPDLLYVEHGHEFDPMCSQGDPLSAVCPADSKRIRQTTSHVLMRYVARPTRGLSTVGHERTSFVAYLALAASFGLRGGLKLAARFARATARLWQEAKVYQRHKARLDRAMSVRLRAFARKHRLCIEALFAIRRLHAAPVTQSVRTMLRSLYVDRLAFVLLAALTIAGSTFVLGVRAAVVLSTVAALGTRVWNAFAAPRDIDPSHRMRGGAAHVARALSVRYVVMGHTHEPRVDALPNQASYVNLGFWGEDELPEDVQPGAAPTCTYFALVRGPTGYVGELLSWDAALGPRPWRADPAASVSGVVPSVSEPVTGAA